MPLTTSNHRLYHCMLFSRKST